MALASGIFGKTFVDALNGTQALNVTTNLGAALLQDVYTPDFDGAASTLATAATGRVEESAVDIVTEPLTSEAIDNGSTTANYLTIDAADITSGGTNWTSITTDTNIHGLAIFDDAGTTPQADPMIGTINFATDYAVSSGSFSVTWAATGIFRIALV